MFKLILFIFTIPTVLTLNYSFLNLPQDHLDIYFSTYPKVAEECDQDPECPFKANLRQNKCFGYEYGCDPSRQYSQTYCPGDHKGWVKTKTEQEKTFYSQADFGYIKQQMNEMMVLCEPMFPEDSSLECSEHLRFCRGRNIMLNFTSLAKRDEPIRYKMDVLDHGEIGGYCKFYPERVNENIDHLSPLQSWAPEIRFFQQYTERPIPEKKCDVVIEKPTFIMKIDARVNMYHHFCDFINLYASQHINALDSTSFSTDVHILIWETYTYTSSFESTFKAFTRHPIWDLKTFRGETVCFKNLVLPLLPRMIFGLYYNTPIIYGCEKSGLFKAFSEHILHRLQVPKDVKKDEKVRITLLSRETKYRRILNENELLEGLREIEGYDVKRVVFNKDISFDNQLKIIRNSDVLIGIHGAGLTHLLFLPDWAAVFEIYNCEDPNCYMDLTRLRGLKYLTWENQDKVYQQDEGTHPEGGAHAKFTNYSFDLKEFLRLVAKAAEHVRHHSKFQEFLNENIEEETCPQNFGTAEPIEFDEISEIDENNPVKEIVDNDIISQNGNFKRESHDEL